MPKVTFNNRKGNFYETLKNAVDTYFQEKKIAKTGDWRLFSKTIILIGSAIGIYILLLSNILPAWAGMLGSAMLGFVLATIGFNVMHDANHGSYSKNKTLNEILGLTMNALGGNAFIWKIKHNITHHTYTNIDGLDDDIAKSPLIRMASTQVWKPAHRFQHIYVFFLYAISSFAWVFLTDMQKYFKRKIHNSPISKIPLKEHIIFWLSKILYVVFYVAIPVYFVGWGAWLVGFSLMHIVMGVTLSLTFQLAHMVEEVEHEHFVAENTYIDAEWAEHQVRTTANFAPQSRLISWLVGGLNFQIEHHLFPRISHVHYPAISKIVKEVCESYNVPYYEAPTLWHAIVSHIKTMKAFGQKPMLVSC
ncbi:fatty acid desaturase family protein [Raineya orbicola]|jgi:linoleoyl-CoA desaturase|uniref:Fatty acid desaturase n=1 Tax=Raineya orbicola TaxID=2016530 RepID=A0A2N3IJK7_9BACT|nr:acyl-CoA desaturase [Raineya orbicola]PKQ70448.1 Fatty acid desaturase [Raineya orbicola]